MYTPGQTDKEFLLASGDRDWWDEDPEYPVSDWRYAVNNDDTRLGYWDWVNTRKNEDRQDDNG